MEILNKINPKKLFLIDSLGALLSALMLGVIMTKFESVFGVPSQTLYFLSLFACMLFIYSTLCFLFFPENWKAYIKILVIVNAMYFCLTIYWLKFLYQGITVLGLAYFSIELVILLALIIIEYKIASN